jgi:hypothetical protein
LQRPRLGSKLAGVGAIAMRAVAAGMAVLLAGQPCAAAQRTTVAEVARHIAAFHGRTVQLDGQVNECVSMTCVICTGSMTDKTAVCLPIDFESDDVRQHDPVGWRTRRVLEELYRFATVRVEAVVDATCTLNHDPADHRPAKDRDFIVCADRSEALTSARVLQVLARAPATAVEFDMYLGEPLREPPDTERAAMLTAAAEARPPAVPGDEVKAFLLGAADAADLRVEAQGVVCRCLEEQCAGRWPTMEGHLIRSPANPYQCDAMFKLNGRWRLEANP